eukprot:CAMPEP_0174229012 /NCGR_PEP_ID=MMETSP0417-20130205/86_1 /TAXON_ID=242541 /ORGANISM="Mayorella sp, Strain BSH-02190019" /LENGTH=138 /DNA_ID=CAMNT_0015306507 /DNA_START=58 /DNA_END=474 /DNA_ORIENTATION=-
MSDTKQVAKVAEKTEKKGVTRPAPRAKRAGEGKQPVRLYVKGVHVGYKRSLVNQHNHTSLLKIQGVNDRAETDFYLGKRVAFIYRARRKTQDTKIRVIWGRISRPHGNSGIVRAKFRNTLPPQSLGASVRVMLFPSRI